MTKYITDLGQQELRTNIVIGCESEDNFPCILIKNSLNKKQISSLSTDNLAFRLNALLSAGDEEFYYHIVKSKKNDYVSRQQFKVVYDYIFNRIIEPVDDTTIYELVESLQEYFTISPEIDTYKLQIGVFGELLAIKVLYETGYKDILNKYHKNFFSKHDIEVSDKIRIEIKTTEKENRIHNFRHDQIYRKDISVYVISSRLEPAQEGLSLYELFVEIMRLYNNPEVIFALEKLMKRCNVSETSVGLKFSLQKAIEDMKFYNANQLPKIEADAPKGVTHISYDVDCSLAEDISVEDLINAIS